MPRKLLVIASLAACAPLPAPGPPVEVFAPEPIEVGVVPPPLPYAPGFDALHYDIDITLPAEGRRIAAVTTVSLAIVPPRADSLHLDLTGLRVHDVAVARGTTDPLTTVPFRQSRAHVSIALPAAAQPGDTLHVRVSYSGEPADGLIIGANLHGAHGAFGDNWPNRARFWFPSIDHPSDKATVAFTVRAPEGWRVLANGRRLDAPAHAPAPPPDGVWRYELAVPIPTYLMVIGATRFSVDVIDACADGGRAPARPDSCVAVTAWAYPPDSARAARAFRRAGEMLEFYARLVAPYPYTKLGHAQSATRFGGMENAGAIFYAERPIAEGRDIDGLIAHEIAHQWFGNAVTPHDWPHLWLSEGFATYFGALFFEPGEGAAAFRDRLERTRRGYLNADVHHLAMVDTLAIPGDNLLNLLNANSYQKGGLVLHMLRGMLGDDVFFAAVRRYYHAHLHGNATTADLQRAFEQRSGRELGWFFEQWAYRPGHPVLRTSFEWDEAARAADIVIEQVQDARWPVFRLPLTIDIETPVGTVRRDIEVRERRTTLRVPLPARPAAVRLDPDGWLLFAAPTA